MPKKQETTEEKLDRVLRSQDDVIKQLEIEKQGRLKAEAALEAKKVKDKKEKDPMSGPGTVCEVTKITKSEAWQVPSKEIINPETQTVETKPDMTMVPNGYAVRPGPTNAMFIVKEPHADRKEFKYDMEVIIPNCRSKYTRELSVKTKKHIQDRGNFKIEPPRITVHLCERHEKLFGAKLEKNLTTEEKAVLNV